MRYCSEAVEKRVKVGSERRGVSLEGTEQPLYSPINKKDSSTTAASSTKSGPLGGIELDDIEESDQPVNECKSVFSNGRCAVSNRFRNVHGEHKLGYVDLIQFLSFILYFRDS